MQDIHSIGAGPLFVGDRRLRPHNNNQPLKCPRCDSLNTKFCYFNNYNLSQPRHFCKSCRRYWTKGGVLRNVPVGGGCRKTKRKNTKPNNPSTDTTATTTVKSTNSHSSSESSSLTATNNGNYELIKTTSFIEEGKSDSNRGIFSEINGNFTGLVTSTSEQLQFGFDSSLLIGSQQRHDQLGGLIDQTVEIRETSDEGFGPLDWDQNQSLFELPNTVDHAYWIDQSQWVEQDHSGLYIP